MSSSTALSMTLTELMGGQLPQLVMFDLDGTLVDSVPDITVAVNAAMNELGVEQIDEALVRQWVGNGAERLIERALQYFQLPCKDVPLRHALQRFMFFYADHASVNTQLYDGVLPFLRYLHEQNIPMAIVTNKPREFVPDILASLEIDHFFSLLMGGDDLPTRKPSPEPLQHCLRHYGCQPSDALMVGDSRNDVEAAKQAGTPVVAVNYGYNHGRPIEAESPNWVVGTLAVLVS